MLRGTFTLDTLVRAAAPALSLSVGGQQLGAELVYNGARLDGIGSGSLVDLGTGTVEEISARLDRAVAVLPLLLPFYDMQLDEYNLAPAGPGYQIGITGRGQQDYDAGRIVSAKMWIATDEYGENWSPVPAAASGSGYVATVDNTSAVGGYVSIKVETRR